MPACGRFCTGEQGDYFYTRVEARRNQHQMVRKEQFPPSGEAQPMKSKAARVLEVLTPPRAEYTAIRLAHVVIGPLAQQPEINEVLRRLVREGLVERRGIGGGNTPYTYRIVRQPPRFGKSAG
jgi:hypothetical protein